MNAQSPPDTCWTRCFGGSNLDGAYSLQQTTDSGYIVAGATNSIGNGGSDYWIAKIDKSGNLEWDHSFGGSLDEYALSIDQTIDSGYVVAGYSYSDTLYQNHGEADYWIVKLNSSGSPEWQKYFGGSANDQAYSIQQTIDTGYIVAGWTASNDGNVSGKHDSTDYWIVKLDPLGNLEWQKCLGGSDDDQAASIQQTADGGYVVAGWTSSNDFDVSGNHGGDDYWVVKLDAGGNKTWQACLGNTAEDQATSIAQTTDGGFIVAGYSFSYSNGDADYWIVKLDESGTMVWQNNFGGVDQEVANSVEQTFDSGFIVCGKAESDTGNQGKHDFWILKLDTGGNLEWEKSLGGDKDDIAFQIQQTIDSGYVVGGWSVSTNGAVWGNHGIRDYWIVKLKCGFTSGIDAPSEKSVSIYPNPVENYIVIDLATVTGDETINVYDVQGRRIILDAIVMNDNASLNTANLPRGLYVLQLTNNKTGKREIGKFVKMK
ncbi:MAG TPA: T9SS type A sorting domain-containing protein [Chitinophagales bacterium]|nr:T9SS type A sorting domain-containing protein [Chitinophagales bacterium]